MAVVDTNLVAIPIFDTLDMSRQRQIGTIVGGRVEFFEPQRLERVVLMLGNVSLMIDSFEFDEDGFTRIKSAKIVMWAARI